MALTTATTMPNSRWRAYLREQAKETAFSFPGIHGGGSTVFDYSPYKNNGTITGAVWKRLPSSSWVLDFDGADDYVTISTTGSFTSLSVLIWVKVPAHDGLFRDALCWGWPDDPYGIGLYFRADTDQYNFRFENTAGTHVSAQRAYTPDTWILISKTWDGTTAYDGINGVNYAGEALDGTITPNADLFLGLRLAAGVQDYYLEGSLALLRISSRYLSEKEIQNHYHQERHLFNV
jgi:hypothetical protein